MTLAIMRKLNTFGLALLGLLLAAGSLSFALAANPPAPQLTRRAFMPAVAGDDSAFIPSQSTPTPAQSSGCAGLRTEVKVLADALAAFDRTPQLAAVNILLAAARPEGITDSTPRIVPAEARVVEVTAYLLGYRRTSSGGIDLAIAQSPGGEAITASFPGASCLSDTPDADKGAMNAARIGLQQACGNPPSSGIFKPLGGSAKLRGVPFWGSKHTNTIGAASGIELGPVLFFEFNDATSCDADAAKTPFPTKTPTPVVQEILTNVLPQVASPGATIQVTISTDPAVAGKLCGYQIWDSNVQLVSEAQPGPTGADGKVSWQVTLPPGMPLGEARVQPMCPGLPTDGSARLTIVP